MPPKDSSNWPPKAPAVRRNFKKAASKPRPSPVKKVASKPKVTKPATKQELNNLVKQRQKPKTENTMNPPGMARMARDARHDDLREKRIAELKARLDRVHGKARADFNRSRGR